MITSRCTPSGPLPIGGSPSSRWPSRFRSLQMVPRLVPVPSMVMLIWYALLSTDVSRRLGATRALTVRTSFGFPVATVADRVGVVNAPAARPGRLQVQLGDANEQVHSSRAKVPAGVAGRSCGGRVTVMVTGSEL